MLVSSTPFAGATQDAISFFPSVPEAGVLLLFNVMLAKS